MTTFFIQKYIIDYRNVYCMRTAYFNVENIKWCRISQLSTRTLLSWKGLQYKCVLRIRKWFDTSEVTVEWKVSQYISPKEEPSFVTKQFKLSIPLFFSKYVQLHWMFVNKKTRYTFINKSIGRITLDELQNKTYKIEIKKSIICCSKTFSSLFFLLMTFFSVILSYRY